MPVIPHLPSRHVRRLRVRAAAEDDARHAATLLGDALRTASLGVADQGRFVVIRRLPLGRISTRVSAASLALHIERVAAEVMADAVSYDLPSAGAANAVAFASRAEAMVALARTHASGASADEWFWPEVVPGWRGDLSRSARWTLLLDAAHATPESAVVAAAVIDRAIAAGVVDEILSDVSQRQALRWLQLEGWSRIGPAAAGPMWRRPEGSRSGTLRRWRSTWDAVDARLVWLATMISVSERPACAADPGLPGRIAFALQALEAGEATSQGDRVRALDANSETRSLTETERRSGRTFAAEPGAAISDRRGAPIDGDAGVSAAPSEAHPVETPPRPVKPPISSPADRTQARDTAARPVDDFAQPFVAPSSEFGGLLFLVRALEQLGFAAFLADHPALLDSAFPARLLYAVGQRAGMPEDDPLALVLRAPAGEDSDEVTLIVAWRTAVRRWCRRYPRIGLRTLVRRHATLHVSRTHIDATFALSDLDVRVRRWALDVDPGWVPWLGRVITFTYGSQHDAH